MSAAGDGGGTPGELVVHDLTLRIDEAEETLAAIRSGAVDALVVSTNGESQVYILKGADQAHRILLETLNEGALTVAADATILYANRRFAELLGLPLERVLGTSLRALVAPESAGAFDALLSEAAAGRSKGEISLRAASGSALPAMASMSAVENEGEPAYTVVVTDLSALKQAETALRQANDDLEAKVLDRTAELSTANDALRAEITERIRLEGELRRRTEELLEADRRKDEFLSMLAHELRNPLAPILTAAEMMRAAADGRPPLERYRGIIERQVRNLTRIVDDLLDVSRITRRAITLDRQVVDLSSVVWSAVEAARPLVDAGSHSLRVTLPAEPVKLFVDPTRLEQIVVNLLNNAAKYTNRGGAIQLAAEQRGGEVVLRVKDNGVGISAELLPHVFDLFVQGENKLDRPLGGLGVGLTLVRSLVEMHGGKVAARSDGPGRGAELTVVLPVAAVATTAAFGESLAAREEAPPPSAHHRVLVVEDNADAAQTLVELLRGWGHDVVHAGDGREALRVAEEHRPHVALVDVGLPGMDGYEVARELRRGPAQGALLIALTGYAQEVDRRRGREAGFDHHLVKPADLRDLNALLCRWGAVEPD